VHTIQEEAPLGLDLVGLSVTPTFSTNLCSDPSNLGSHSTSHTLAA
jgi:hypothetical protein